LPKPNSVLLICPEQGLLVETAGYLQSEFPTLVLSGDLNDRQRKRLWHEVSEQSLDRTLWSHLSKSELSAGDRTPKIATSL